LLLAVPAARADELLAALRDQRTPCAVVVGEVVSRGSRAVELV
jgi:hypothetical protein